MEWRALRLCLVGPTLPRSGGVSIQTELHLQFLRAAGATAHRISTNFPRLRRLPLVGRWLHPLAQPVLILAHLLATLPGSHLVHVHAASYWGFMPAAVALLAARLLGKPLVITYHGSKAEDFLARYRGLALAVFRRADTVIVLSDWTQAMFRTLGLDTEQMPILIDTERFTFQERAQTPPIVLWAKGLSARTNPAMAIRALARVQQARPDVTLWLAGDGALLPEMRRLAASVGARVDFLGNVPFAEIHHLYRRAGIFWNTSRLDNMPDNVLEASACGLAVVATRVGGVPLIVRDGENALLVDLDDDAALAVKTLDILAQPDLARRLGRAARANAEQYGWPVLGPRLLDMYRRALTGRVAVVR